MKTYLLRADNTVTAVTVLSIGKTWSVVSLHMPRGSAENQVTLTVENKYLISEDK